MVGILWNCCLLRWNMSQLGFLHSILLVLFELFPLFPAKCLRFWVFELLLNCNGLYDIAVF